MLYAGFRWYECECVIRLANTQWPGTAIRKLRRYAVQYRHSLDTNIHIHVQGMSILNSTGMQFPIRVMNLRYELRSQICTKGIPPFKVKTAVSKFVSFNAVTNYGTAVSKCVFRKVGHTWR